MKNGWLEPVVMPLTNALTRCGYENRSSRKLNASPAGITRMTKIVRTYFISNGPRGVPKGFVDAKNSGQGRRP